MPRSRLWFRVYLGTVVALAAMFALTILYSRVTFADRRRETEAWSKNLFADLAKNRADPEALQKSLAWMKDVSSISVTLYGHDGRLVASTAEPGEARLTAMDQRRVLLEGTSLLGFSTTGVRVAFDDGTVGVGVVHYRGAQSTQTLVWLGSVLVLLLLLALLFTRHLVKPLQRIAGAATRFGKGDLAARSGVQRSDEIGDVARALDESSDRVTRLMSAQRELLANVSHELRTPLARMQVALDLLADGVTKESVEVLPEIAADLAELERLIDDVMTVTRLELAQSDRGLTPLRREITRPEELLSRAAARFRSMHPGRSLEVHVGQGVAAVDVDPVLVRRVIDNLIDNARKYSEANTPIAVDLSAQPRSVALTVRDRGIGIEQADLEKVFTPFFRTDRSRSRQTGGVGLGLVFARRVVEAHGGTIRIESEVGKGTAVRFDLPAP